MTQPLRAIPSVEKVLEALGSTQLPRPVLVALVRRELAELRRQKDIPGLEEIVARIKDAARNFDRARIQRVINGTGVLVHTNLGRSPLSAGAIKALTAAAANYNNLEYDLVTGERGGRAAYLEQNLAALCGAEAATVVNNCAAALVLVLRHFVKPPRDQVVISRGELVQIGGGFRIPEILETSGARLREIGATNKTALADYSKAIGPHTALILKVHRSNFFMGGFVESPATREIAALAKKKKVPFVEDLGSGAVVPTDRLAEVEHEPTPAEVLKNGVDLVTFSGDKLMGGPQAGILAGKARLVSALKREPFFRALRCDKLVLAALQATVDAYLSGQEADLPIIRMLSLSQDTLRLRAEKIVADLKPLPFLVRIGEGRAQIGGGTLPRSSIPSVTLDFQPPDLQAFADTLRNGETPIVGYVGGGKFRIDLRTVFPEQDAELTNAILTAPSRSP